MPGTVFRLELQGSFLPSTGASGRQVRMQWARNHRIERIRCYLVKSCSFSGEETKALRFLFYSNPFLKLWFVSLSVRMLKDETSIFTHVVACVRMSFLLKAA